MLINMGGVVKNQAVKVSLLNMLNPDTFTLSGATMTDGVLNYTAGVFGMVMQSMPDAIANHTYYGRCYQKTEPGYTQADGRFEMMKNDEEQNRYTFGTFFDTNGEWVRISDCISHETPAAEAYNLRSFTVNPTTNAYRKELIIIDLTAAFGAGNEPAKDWCDTHIPYFVGQKEIWYEKETMA